MIREPIQSINHEGFVMHDGTTYPVDVIIAATGYDTTYIPAYPLVGRNGIDLRSRWSKNGAEAYFTCAVPDMPNYFSKAPSLEIMSPSDRGSSGGRSQFAHIQRVSYACN